MHRAARWLVVVVLSVAASAQAQEPETRAEALRRQREEKAQSLKPPEPSGFEKWLVRLEDGRLFDRLLSPPEGLYPKLGNITPGSGFAAGPGYRYPRLVGPVDFSTFATVSTMRYWMVEGRLHTPHVAGVPVAVDVYGQLSDFPREQFYGVGPDSSRLGESYYALANTAVGASATLQARPWFLVGGSVEGFAPRVEDSEKEPSIIRRFTPEEVPGLLAPSSTFIRYGATAEVNYREPRGNPRRGGRYALAYQRFDDQRDGRYSFDRIEVDLQQYVPLLKDRRVLAFHALGSFAGNGAVPFYLLRTLGGPDDLRGFRRFRFRDEAVLLLQAEYRWEIFTAVDGALFYDAGTVAPQASQLSLDKMDHDWGIGFRFGTINGIFMRVEGAFGSRDGRHFVLRFGHVF